MIDQGNIENQNLLPGHTIIIERQHIGNIPEIIISTIQMQKGKKLEEVLEQWEELDRPAIGAVLSRLSFEDNGISL